MSLQLFQMTIFTKFQKILKTQLRSKKRFSVATVIPIVKKFNSKWITIEIFDIISSALAARRIGFGAGDCDPSVPITINRNTFNLEME